MGKKSLVLVLTSVFFFACTDNSFEVDSTRDYQKPLEVPKIDLKQAEMYASVFSGLLNKNDTPGIETRTTTSVTKEIENIDFLIEDGDTLLYAFNYKDGGFILIAADNTSFPILAHAKEGNLDLNNINEKSGLTLFIETVKNEVKESLENPGIVDSEYYDELERFG